LGAEKPEGSGVGHGAEPVGAWAFEGGVEQFASG
jgi:hypothetical protein